MRRNPAKPKKPERVLLGIRVRPQDRDTWYALLANDDLNHAPGLFADMLQIYIKEKGGAC